MEDSCKACAEKDAEIVAIRSANEGLRAKVREMEQRLDALEANVLAQFADYDEKVAKLRRRVAADIHAKLEIAAKPSPG